MNRATDANNFEADLFLSIHCNAGGGTGTETFWCDLDKNGGLNPNRDEDKRFARLGQKHMVDTGTGAVQTSLGMGVVAWWKILPILKKMATPSIFPFYSFPTRPVV